jgi:hypothetical protein
VSVHSFIHVGDAHLQASHPRNADRLASLDQIVRYGLGVPTLAGWLWPGDLFHARSTAEDRNAIAELLERMATRSPVILTVGNHEETREELRIFERLRTVHAIHVITEAKVIQFRTGTARTAACFALPYPQKGALVAAGVQKDAVADVAVDLLEPIFMAAAADLYDAEQLGQIPLMVGHVNVGGAVTSVGQPMIGHEIELNPALLARLGPICKALNHVHKHQAIAGAVYAGSTSRHDYGEMEEKGFVEWTFDDSVICAEPNVSAWSWRFVPLTTPRQLQVDGRLDRDGFWIDAVNGEFPPTTFTWEDADIRCRYTFQQADVSALDVAKIHAAFAGCRSLKLDPVAVLEHQVRAPEIAAAATLEQKIERYCERHGVTYADGLAHKLAALQSHDAPALLTALGQSLQLAGTAMVPVAEQAVA